MILQKDVVASAQAWEQAYFVTAAADNANLFVAYEYLPAPTDNPVVPYSAHQWYQTMGQPLDIDWQPTVEYEITMMMYTMILFGQEDDPVGILDKRALQWADAMVLGQLAHIDQGITR